MRLHAEQAYPNECCGLMLGNIEQDGNVLVEVQSMKNSWNDQIAEELEGSSWGSKLDRYWIDPAEMLVVMKAARKRNLDMIGVYHSHPNHEAVPSECDRQLAWQQYSYVIISVQQGTAQDLYSWRLDENHQFQPENVMIQK